MRDYLLMFPGITSSTILDVSGWSDPAANTNHVAVKQGCLYDQLSSAPVVKGNKVYPNSHSFTKTSRENYAGVEVITTFGNRAPSAGGGSGITSIQTTTGYWDNTPAMLTAPSDLSYNKCLNDLYEQMRGNLDLSIGLAESGKTVKMLKSAITLAKYVGGFHPRHWAKHWLEYKFGWYPLVQDLYGISKEIAYRAPKLQRFRARATVKDRKIVTTKTTTTTEQRTFTSSLRTEVGCVYAPSQSTMTNLSRVTSLNPASIAWELLPFSFIVDYVINIGGALRSLESSLVLTGGFSVGYVTSTSKLRVDGVVTGNGKLVSGQRTTGTRKGFHEDKLFSRGVLLALPKPMVPRFNTNLGATQLLTVAAVLSNFINTEPDKVQKVRRITNAALDNQLRSFQKGHHRWSSGIT